jgi:enoyl-CoA hydratase
MTTDPSILIEKHGAVTVLTLNRPKRLNALNSVLMAELVAALKACDSDGVTRAVVVTGDDRAFAAGADITEFLTPEGPMLDIWDGIRDVGIPIIAAVRGFALGGGLELAMACDMMVVAEDARLGQPEINLGLIPGAGGTQRLTRAVGKAIAMEIVLLGREMTGIEANARGLANACVPSERVLPKAIGFAQEIARRAPVATREGKRNVNAAFETPLADGLAEERRTFNGLLQTPDGREGIAAFSEKRKPNWSGK